MSHGESLHPTPAGRPDPDAGRRLSCLSACSDAELAEMAAAEGPLGALPVRDPAMRRCFGVEQLEGTTPAEADVARGIRRLHDRLAHASGAEALELAAETLAQNPWDFAVGAALTAAVERHRQGGKIEAAQRLADRIDAELARAGTGMTTVELARRVPHDALPVAGATPGGVANALLAATADPDALPPALPPVADKAVDHGSVVAVNEPDAPAGEADEAVPDDMTEEATAPGAGNDETLPEAAPTEDPAPAMPDSFEEEMPADFDANLPEGFDEAFDQMAAAEADESLRETVVDLPMGDVLAQVARAADEHAAAAAGSLSPDAVPAVPDAEEPVWSESSGRSEATWDDTPGEQSAADDTGPAGQADSGDGGEAPTGWSDDDAGVAAPPEWPADASEAVASETVHPGEAGPPVPADAESAAGDGEGPTGWSDDEAGVTRPPDWPADAEQAIASETTFHFTRPEDDAVPGDADGWSDDASAPPPPPPPLSSEHTGWSDDDASLPSVPDWPADAEQAVASETTHPSAVPDEVRGDAAGSPSVPDAAPAADVGNGDAPEFDDEAGDGNAPATAAATTPPHTGWSTDSLDSMASPSPPAGRTGWSDDETSIIPPPDEASISPSDFMPAEGADQAPEEDWAASETIPPPPPPPDTVAIARKALEGRTGWSDDDQEQLAPPAPDGPEAADFEDDPDEATEALPQESSAPDGFAALDAEGPIAPYEPPDLDTADASVASGDPAGDPAASDSSDLFSTSGGDPFGLTTAEVQRALAEAQATAAGVGEVSPADADIPAEAEPTEPDADGAPDPFTMVESEPPADPFNTSAARPMEEAWESSSSVGADDGPEPEPEPDPFGDAPETWDSTPAGDGDATGDLFGGAPDPWSATDASSDTSATHLVDGDATLVDPFAGVQADWDASSQSASGSSPDPFAGVPNDWDASSEAGAGSHTAANDAPDAFAGEAADDPEPASDASDPFATADADWASGSQPGTGARTSTGTFDASGASAPDDDPFTTPEPAASAVDDPFATVTSAPDPFDMPAGTGDADDPFRTSASLGGTDVIFGPPAETDTAAAGATGPAGTADGDDPFRTSASIGNTDVLFGPPADASEAEAAASAAPDAPFPDFDDGQADNQARDPFDDPFETASNMTGNTDRLFGPAATVADDDDADAIPEPEPVVEDASGEDAEDTFDDFTAPGEESDLQDLPEHEPGAREPLVEEPGGTVPLGEPIGFANQPVTDDLFAEGEDDMVVSEAAPVDAYVAPSQQPEPLPDPVRQRVQAAPGGLVHELAGEPEVDPYDAAIAAPEPETADPDTPAEPDSNAPASAPTTTELPPPLPRPSTGRAASLVPSDRVPGRAATGLRRRVDIAPNADESATFARPSLLAGIGGALMVLAWLLPLVGAPRPTRLALIDTSETIERLGNVASADNPTIATLARERAALAWANRLQTGIPTGEIAGPDLTTAAAADAAWLVGLQLDEGVRPTIDVAARLVARSNDVASSPSATSILSLASFVTANGNIDGPPLFAPTTRAAAATIGVVFVVWPIAGLVMLLMPLINHVARDRQRVWVFVALGLISVTLVVLLTALAVAGPFGQTFGKPWGSGASAGLLMMVAAASTLIAAAVAGVRTLRARLGVAR